MSERLSTGEVVNGILKGLVAAGMVGSIFIAPNLAQVGDLALRYLDKRSRKLRDARVMYYMKRRNLIDYQQQTSGNYELHITKQGRARELKARLDNLMITKPPKWDKKWRLVMFDIPEDRRKSRSNLSQKLRQLNFYQLQKSVWVYPYPCQKEVATIKEAYQIPEDCVLLADIVSIEREEMLRKKFAL